MEKKTTPMDNGGSMAYVLCAITALGILLNLILVIWHCKNLQRRSYLAVTVKYTLLLLNVSYIIAGFAIIVMVLHRDFGGDALCKAGGFLVMFSTQESIWTLAGSCASLFLWTQNKMSQELQKHNIPIFFLILVIQGLVLLVLSFLPFTEMHYFDTHSPYYYLCVPLRFPGEKSWAYSSLILVMNWISIVLSVTIVLVIIIKYRKNFSAQGINRKDASVRQSKSLKYRTQLATGIYIALCVDIICWFIILVTINSGYFNQDGHSRNRIQWILGFSVAGTTVLHSVILLGTSMVKQCQACCCCTSGEINFEKLNAGCPKSLEQVEKIPKHHGDYNIRRYLVHWNDPLKANFRAGVMKVFPPWCKSKWQNEVHTLWKLQQHEPHPNIVKYVWVASQNHFHEAICVLTGDVLSRESSITCTQQYPNGTLEQYLRTRVGHLTEVGMHKIVLDMARGLSYLQGHRMVHNNLTSQAIYMASISDKTGLKVVIGDFEECQEVPKEDASRKKMKQTKHPLFDLYSISQHVDRLAMENNCFSADIRSFGLILLELLACVSQHNHRRQLRVDAVTRSADDVREMSRPRPMRQAQPTKSSTHQHNGAACTCSSRVTDIRAHKGKQSGHHGESFQTASTDDQVMQSAVDSFHARGAKSGQLHSLVPNHHHQSSFQEYKSPKAGKTNVHHGETQILPRRLSEDSRSVRSSANKKESKSKKGSSRESQSESEDIVRSSMSSKRSKASSTAGSVKSQRSMSDDASSTHSKIQDRALPPLPKEAAKHVREAWVEGEIQNSDHLDMTDAQSEGSQVDGAAKTPEKVTKQQKAIKTNPKPNRLLQLLPFSKATPVLTLQDSSHTEESSDFKPIVVRPRSAGGPAGRSGLKTNGSLILSSARPGMVCKPKAPCSKVHVMSDGYGGKRFSCGHLDEIHGPDSNPAEPTNGGPHVRSRSMDATSLASLASFETIYEEDADHGNHPRPPRPARLSRFHIPVTQLPSIPNDVESVSVYGTDDGMSETSSIRNGMTYLGGRNPSFLSLDDSVISADSGIGGNSGSDYATQSDVSSYYFNNRVGAREPIYSANESVSDSDTYSAFRVFITKNKRRLKLRDSGVESAADSCDDVSCANGYQIDQLEGADTGHLAAKGARVDSDTRVNLVSGMPDMFESDTASIQTIYEQLAEVEPKQQVQVEDSDQNEATEASGFHSTSGTSSPFSMIETSTKGTQTGSSLTRPKHNNDDESSQTNTSKEIAYEKIAHPVKVTKTVSTSTEKDETTSETSNPHNGTAGRQYTYRKTGEGLRHAETSPFVLHDKFVHDSFSGQNVLTDCELQKHTSNPNSQINSNRLHANVGAHRLSRPSLNQRSAGTRHHQGQGHRQNSSYSPRDIHHRQPSRPASMASLISDAQQILQAFGMSTSFHDDSVVEEYLSPEGATSVTSNFSSDLMTSHELDPRSGLGPQQLKYCNDLSIKYSFVHLGILLTPDKTKLSNMLGIMKQHGKLGYTASQMVPLLADCWLEDPVPNAGDILDRLNEVLPTAAV